MVSLVLIAACLLMVCIWKYFSNKSNTKRFPPGPPRKPFIGHLLDLREPPHLLLEKWTRQCGPIISWTMFNLRSVSVSRVDLVKKLFMNDSLAPYTNDRFEGLQGKYIMWNYQDVLFGHSAENLGRLRKAMHKGLRLYGDGVNSFENIVQEELKRVVKLLKDKGGQDFDPRPVISDSLGNLISILLSGEQIQSSEESKIIWNFSNKVLQSLRPMTMLMTKVFPFLRHVPGPIRTTIRDVMKARDDVIYRYYTRYRETYKHGKVRGYSDALFQLQEDELDENGVSWLKDEQIKGLILDIIFAGLMTTTNAILIAFLILVNHPQCLEKLKKEILETVGRDKAPSLKDRQNMPYIQAVILETLRYSSHIASPPPHRCTKDIEFEGYHIPATTMLSFNLWYIHHDPEVWGDPWQFRPERFLDDNGQLLPPEHKLRQSLILFGVGKRSCVGETMARSRMFLYLATLIQNFDLRPPNDHELASHDPHGYSDTVILEPHEYFITAVPRT